MNRRSFFARVAAITGSILAACSPGAIRLAEAQPTRVWRKATAPSDLQMEYREIPLDRMWENIEPRMSGRAELTMREQAYVRALSDGVARYVYGTRRPRYSMRLIES